MTKPKTATQLFRSRNRAAYYSHQQAASLLVAAHHVEHGHFDDAMGWLFEALHSRDLYDEARAHTGMQLLLDYPDELKLATALHSALRVRDPIDDLRDVKNAIALMLYTPVGIGKKGVA